MDAVDLKDVSPMFCNSNQMRRSPPSSSSDETSTKLTNPSSEHPTEKPLLIPKTIPSKTKNSTKQLTPLDLLKGMTRKEKNSHM